ncbi:hypothetical protein J7E38_04250 [Bacillus sp. ISL-35]|uniref:hypothetical protein n=1 Tax=Bacillus sp. ISL-35 TaxID=2819122 RepID=UPI001BE5FBC8|nr:hypothetical protein [Bacillus sp. ISL-35]MBT2678199.1 hypothetical protein [Bacillus sp. ISL-35]MBT2702514.1 hypothetical protein [Chryseobacterium sp. ISL-80]
MEDERARDLFGFKLRTSEQDVSAETGHDFDHFDHFMFGGQKNIDESNDHPAEPFSPLSKYLDHIDLDEVMYHVDTLITSARELKPLLGKVKPFFDQIIDKNKS